MKFRCAHCRRWADKPASEVNRARRGGLRLFCNRRCAGLGRRKWKTKAQKKAEKAAYDAGYRAENRAMLKAKKHAWFQRTYDPVRAAKERKKTMKRHVEYCRRPEYKAKKHQYDVDRYAEQFGSFAEAHKLVMELSREIKERTTDNETRQQKGTFGKSQSRRRADGGQATRFRSREDRHHNRRRDRTVVGQ